LHKRDLVLLNHINNFFGVGTITNDGTYIVYAVKTVKNLIEIIIPHFNSFPLLTKKYADFELFKQIVFIMAKKGHLLSESFQEIMGLRASLNLGISEKLKNAFPNIIPVSRPELSLR